MSTPYTPPPFLVDLLEARSPTGVEFEAQAVVDRYLRPVADEYAKDALGNRLATLNPTGNPCLLLAGHMDELGLIIKFVDKDGFLYFDTLGGHDRGVISGRRVRILTKDGVVKGVTGKRAIHLMNAKERDALPEIHQIWIDIGAKSRKDAMKRVRLGDSAVYDVGFELLHGSVGAARAFDNKAGCYVVAETLRRLAERRKKLKAKVVSVATTQEEIGTRGAITAGYAVNPDIAIAVDVSHATDAPDSDHKRFGEYKLGGGPILARGPNINPLVFDRLVECAEEQKIPYQIETESMPTGTDARALQMARAGVATGLVGIPLRYMHTPSEVVDLEDVEKCVRLLEAFALSLQPGEKMHF
jgi:endoglucanase